MMRLKTDTKEKFTVITPQETEITAIMAEEWGQTLLAYLQKDMPHTIVNLEAVMAIDAAAANMLAAVQHRFYEENRSCVICCMAPGVEKTFEDLELLETMNVTPTESEAWDIVQMEEIERELLGDE
jgi:anti-anti-sigma factor